MGIFILYFPPNEILFLNRNMFHLKLSSKIDLFLSLQKLAPSLPTLHPGFLKFSSGPGWRWQFCPFPVPGEIENRERGWVCRILFFLLFFLGWIWGCWVVSTHRETGLEIPAFHAWCPETLTFLVSGNFPPSSRCILLSLASS